MINRSEIMLKEHKKNYLSKLVYDNGIVNEKNIIQLILDYWFEKGRYIPNWCIYPLFIKYLDNKELEDSLCFLDVFKKIPFEEGFTFYNLKRPVNMKVFNNEKFEEYIMTLQLTFEEKNNISNFYNSLTDTDKVLFTVFLLKSNDVYTFIDAINNLNNFSEVSRILIKQLLSFQDSNLPHNKWMWDILYYFYKFLAGNPDELLALASATVIYINVKYRYIKKVNIRKYNVFVEEYNSSPNFTSLVLSLEPLFNYMSNVYIDDKEKRRVEFLMEYIELNK